MTIKLHREYNVATDGFALAIYTLDHNGRAFVQPFTMKLFDRAAAVERAEAFAIQDDGFERGPMTVNAFLQAVLDFAWAEGMRPVGAKDHTNELAAVRYHLEDMRTLALGKKPEPPDA